MTAWLARDNWGGTFAYSNEPRFEDGIWHGQTLLFVMINEIPDKAKTLLEQQKAVRVDIHLTATKIVLLPN